MTGEDAQAGTSTVGETFDPFEVAERLQDVFPVLGGLSDDTEGVGSRRAVFRELRYPDQSGPGGIGAERD